MSRLAQHFAFVLVALLWGCPAFAQQPSYSLLHQFTGVGGDGANPQGSLTLNGSRLYGLTSKGGSASGGVLFQIGTDGSDYAVVHTFVGGPNDGSTPEGSLSLDGTTLYGLSFLGAPKISASCSRSSPTGPASPCRTRSPASPATARVLTAPWSSPAPRSTG